MTTHFDQAFLIDVSEEDDSLLLVADEASRRNLDDSLHSVSSSPDEVQRQKECDVEGGVTNQENLLSQPVSIPKELGNLTSPVLQEAPDLTKKKKCTFNIGKNMARNSAFLTDEAEVPRHEDCNEGAATNEEETCPLSEPVSITQEPIKLDSPFISEDPALTKKKKKKSGFNVRKSMAWNSAFLTEEGVLDTEELLLVNKTFQKPASLEKRRVSKKPTPSSRLAKPPLICKPSVTANKVVNKVVLNAESKENPITPALTSCEGSMEKLLDTHAANHTGPDGLEQKVNSSLSTRNVVRCRKEKLSISTYVDSSKLNPSVLRRSTEKNDQASTSVTSRDGTELKHAVNDRMPAADLEISRRSSIMKSTMEGLSSTAMLHSQRASGSSKLESEGSSLRTYSAPRNSALSEGFRSCTGRDKPSGLRMPSPKLGFFDMSKTQVAVLRERTNGHGYGGSRTENSMIGSRNSVNHLQQMNSAKFGQQLLEASRNQSKGIRNSTKLPMATQVHGHHSKFASLQIAPAHESHKSASHLHSAARGTERVLQARKTGQNAAIPGKPLCRGQQGVGKSKGQENLCPNGNEGTGIAQESVAQDLHLLDPTIVATGNVCDSKVRICDNHTENTISSASISANHSLSSSVETIVESNKQESNKGCCP